MASAAVKGRAKSGSHRLSDDEYAALLAAQGGHCALCPSTPKTRRLDTDRDHATGLVRGLLCHRCNRNLPTWVTPAWCVRASSYLTFGLPPQLRLTEIRACGTCGEPADGNCSCHHWPGES